MNPDQTSPPPPRYKHPRLRRLVVVISIIFGIVATSVCVLTLAFITAFSDSDCGFVAIGPGVSEICYAMDSVQVRGRVFNQLTNQPVPNATVHIEVGEPNCMCEHLSGAGVIEQSYRMNPDGTFDTTVFFNTPPREITAVVDAEGCLVSPFNIPLHYNLTWEDHEYYTSDVKSRTPSPGENRWTRAFFPSPAIDYLVEMTIPLTCSA